MKTPFFWFFEKKEGKEGEREGTNMASIYITFERPLFCPNAVRHVTFVR